jgi:hypothetical protein
MASEVGDGLARDFVDSAGARGPEPRLQMRVIMSEHGRLICKAHGMFCPENEAETGRITKIMDGMVNVEWEGNPGPAECCYLVGKYDKHMLKSADRCSSQLASACRIDVLQDTSAAAAQDPDCDKQAWWKGNPKVLVHDPALGCGQDAAPLAGRLVGVLLLVDGAPNEIKMPTRCIVPSLPLFHCTQVPTPIGDVETEYAASGQLLKVHAWWEQQDPTVRICESSTPLDGASAIAVGLEVQVKVDNRWRAPQHLPLGSVTLNAYIVGSQLLEDGDYETSVSMLEAALTEAMLHRAHLLQLKILLHLAGAQSELGRYGNALAHLQHGHAVLQQQQQQQQQPAGAREESEMLGLMLQANFGEIYRMTGDNGKV